MELIEKWKDGSSICFFFHLVLQTEKDLGSISHFSFVVHKFMA